MFFSNCTATTEKNLEYDIHKYLNPEYANVRYIDMDEINRCNATFLDDGKYYQAIKINNISEKEAIMEFAKKEKLFDNEQNEILNSIMEKNSIEVKDNFFDYYD